MTEKERPPCEQNAAVLASSLSLCVLPTPSVFALLSSFLSLASPHTYSIVASPFPRPQLLLPLCFVVAFLCVCCPFLPNPSASSQVLPPPIVFLSLWCVIHKNKKTQSLTLLHITKNEKDDTSHERHTWRDSLALSCQILWAGSYNTHTCTCTIRIHTQILSLTHIKTRSYHNRYTK